MTDSEILILVDGLEHCRLGKDEFHHRDHLAVAVVYLYAGDFDSALQRMRASLTRFAAHHGVAGLYHETLTSFWLQQVERRLDRESCLRESVEEICRQLADKDLPYAYYTRELLNSPQSRSTWVRPDLEPASSIQK